MDNKYTYYTSDNQNQNQYSYSYQEKPQKPKRGIPKWVKVICLGLAFGLAASVAFQAGNFVMTKFFGINTTAEETKAVGNTTISTNSKSTVNSEVAEIAKNCMPSVVSITNMSVQQVQSFFGGIQEQESKSAGSGIIIAQNDEELLIVTNNHVVEGNDTLTVSFVDEESVEANIKGTDAGRDLAVIAVQMDDIKESTLNSIAVAQLGDSTKLQVGEPAIAIGNALGYGQSVTTGIISATQRVLEGFDSELIQTDAAINPGNSGGALLNANGEVIGINTIKVATSEVEGMGYAIPISDASEIIEKLMNQKTKTKVAEGKRGFIGISGYDVDEDSAMMYNMPMGVYVAEVESGSAADKAGIKKGNIITALGGTTVDSMAALQEQLQYYAAGDQTEITISILGENGDYVEKTLEITLGKKPQ
ncbi:MAG: S1C family serine protease [Dorea sp.]